MEIESGEIRYRREWIPFVPGAIMENGRLVIHNSMGNFAEAEKTIRNIRTQSCRKFDRRFDKRQE